MHSRALLSITTDLKASLVILLVFGRAHGTRRASTSRGAEPQAACPCHGNARCERRCAVRINRCLRVRKLYDGWRNRACVDLETDSKGACSDSPCSTGTAAGRVDLSLAPCLARVPSWTRGRRRKCLETSCGARGVGVLSLWGTNVSKSEVLEGTCTSHVVPHVEFSATWPTRKFLAFGTPCARTSIDRSWRRSTQKPSQRG
jgi:hypothetical protein